MISVDLALQHIFDLADQMPVETVPLAKAFGRTLKGTLTARRDQPPFAASAMDGYALRHDAVAPGATFRVIGESAAGAAFSGDVSPGSTVRIFTGAPVPNGTDRVVIQEDVTRTGDTITLGQTLDSAHYIRPAAADFAAGTKVTGPLVLRPNDIALLAAMNIAEVPVSRRPVVALIATGDELVMPGETPGPDQIIASNTFGLQAMINAAGARARILPIARDNVASLTTVFDMASDADLIVTIGGASVGDHDLVASVAETLGMQRAFYKVAMRPGKPLMAGRLNEIPMIGLPGNPVSSMVCGHIFILPLLRAMLGLGQHPAPRKSAPLAHDIDANGAREHFMRARLTDAGLTPFNRQDSALLSVLAEANGLLVRQANDPPRKMGDLVKYVPI